jgi:hypothetical protein
LRVNFAANVGDDVFHRSGGQDFQMRGGTGNGRGWRHHPTLAHGSQCPCWTVKLAYGHMRVRLSKIQANWHQGEQGARLCRNETQAVTERRTSDAPQQHLRR